MNQAITTGPLPRTEDAITTKIKGIIASNSDFFGVMHADMLRVLPYAVAKPFLVVTATEEKWNEHRVPATREAVVKAMLDYMPFAWEKANNCRGLSAGRSVQHMQAWLWLLDNPLGEKLEGIYQYYGKPCLRAVCEAYGWDWRQWDDGLWRNSEDDDGVPPQETGL